MLGMAPQMQSATAARRRLCVSALQLLSLAPHQQQCPAQVHCLSYPFGGTTSTMAAAPRPDAIIPPAAPTTHEPARASAAHRYPYSSALLARSTRHAQGQSRRPCALSAPTACEDSNSALLHWPI